MGYEKESYERDQNDIFRLLNTFKGETFDVCAVAFKIICQSTSQVPLFRYFLEAGVSTESNESIEIDAYFTASAIKKLKNSCEDMVDGVLNKLVHANLDEEEFYIKLWSSIQNNDIFATNDEKIYALYSVFSDRRIPYFKLDSGLKMSNEEFASITESIQDDVKKVVYILNVRLEQKTEVASLLVKILNSYDTIEKQSVLLVHILRIVQQNTGLSRLLVEKILSKQ